MANVLVTGGTGFVGRHVTSTLISRGHTVRVVSRKADASLRGVEFQQIDDLFSASRAELSTVLNGADVVVHLAWHVDPKNYLISDRNWACLSGSLRLALVARDLEVSHFVGIGTCVEYEQTKSIRTPTTRLDPNTAYGAAKASLFFALREIFRNSRTDLAWCRLFFLHGEGEHPARLVPQIKSQLVEGVFPHLRNPYAIRDYLDVSEAGRMVAEVVDSHLTGSFNVCSGTAKSVLELAVGIAEQMGRFDLAEQGKKSYSDQEQGATDVILGEPAPDLPSN